MSTSSSVSCQIDDSIALITLDDGKRNALSPAVFEAIYAALDEAEKAEAQVIITGREGIFSAGFDIKVMKSGGAPQALNMLRLGYSLTARLMSYPYPVVAACNGHSFAMGVFMMLSTDYIIGTRGDFQISANEVALGLTMPRVAARSLKHRLTPSAYQRAVTVSEIFTPETALAAGFFDTLVEADDLLSHAKSQCQKFKELDMPAHARSKLRIREDTIRSIKRDVFRDIKDAVVFAMRGSKPKSKIG